MSPVHAARALRAIALREIFKFSHQTSRLLSALVRPALWLIVFAAGFRHALDVAVMPPYESAITYPDYILPGLLGMVLLFNGMQSSLALVYDREIGMMRLILTAPLPRWYLLFCKLLAGSLLSILQAYAFLLLAWAFGARLPWAGWIEILPALLLSGLMLGAVGLLVSVHVRQIENFAGAMNFVIFPMFFLSTALYPLAQLEDGGAQTLAAIARINPFTHAVELIRFAAYGEIAPLSLAVVAGVAVLCFGAAALGYDPLRGTIRRRGGPAAA